LHQNAFGGRAPPGPAGGAIIALPHYPRPDPLAVMGEGREGRKREGEKEEGKGREGGKGEGKGTGTRTPLKKVWLRAC